MDGSTNYVHVRRNVVAAARRLGFSAREIEIIERAFLAVSISDLSISGRIVEGAITPGQTFRPVTVTLTLPNGREIVQTTGAGGSFRFDNLGKNSMYRLRFEHGMIETQDRPVFVRETSVTGLVIRLIPLQGNAVVTFRLEHNDTYNGEIERQVWHETVAIGSEIREYWPGWTIVPESLTVSATGDNIIRISGIW